MTRLVLVQRNVPIALNYHGFTVKYGAWYGVIKTPFGTIPVAWSGWTCRNEIALYTLTGDDWKLRWVNGEEIDYVHVCSDVDYANEEEYDIGEVPWFAIEAMRYVRRF